MFFFFNDTATPEIYTLSLHDALPILTETEQSAAHREPAGSRPAADSALPAQYSPTEVEQRRYEQWVAAGLFRRSEEHTSELQSRQYLVCRLLLETKKRNTATTIFRMH